MTSQILGESSADADYSDCLQNGHASEVVSYRVLCGSLLIGGSIIDLIILADYVIRDLTARISVGGAIEERAVVFAAILVCSLLVGASLIRKPSEERRMVMGRGSRQ